MNAFRLLLLLLLIVVAVVVVLVVLRRGSAQRDAQRVEAAGLRSEAENLNASMAGQTAFAEQAAQRAELARVEAEDKAREAERLEAEAAQHQASVAAVQRDYESTMRRADDIDPDVKESAFPPVADDGSSPDAADEPASAVSGSSDAAPAPAAAAAPAAVAATDPGEAGDASTSGAGEDVPMTRAERREAREAQEFGASDSVQGGGAALPTAGAGLAAAGTSAWAARDDETSPHSERIASAADYRDDVPGDEPGAGAHGAAAAATSEPEHDGPQDHHAPGQDHDAPGQDAGGVYGAPATGSDAGMSEDTRTETTDDTQHDGLGAGEAAGAAAAGAGGAYAATRAMHESEQSEPAPDQSASSDTDGATGESGSSDTDRAHEDLTTDVSHDVESPRGEWGGPHDETTGEADGTEPDGAAGTADRSEGGDVGGMTIIGEPEAYASTEPLMAQDQTAPVSPDSDEDTRVGDHSHAAETTADDDEAGRVGDSTSTDRDNADHEHADHDGTDHVDADHSASTSADTDVAGEHPVAETAATAAATDGTGGGGEHDSTQDRHDPTPTRDWASDEGELLEENAERGDRLEQQRAELAEQSDDTAGATASGTDAGGRSHEATSDATGATASADGDGDHASEATGDAAGQDSSGRRISGFDELRDGGFGVGSAAPLDDGAQPLDHPVQAYRDTMTYRMPGDPGYDSADPHVWFYDEGAAQRSGFRRSDG